jgi:hypothetical protein
VDWRVEGQMGSHDDPREHVQGCGAKRGGATVAIGTWELDGGYDATLIHSTYRVLMRRSRNCDW